MGDRTDSATRAVEGERTNRPHVIVDLLRERILKGELRPGERLLAERKLALELGTNRNTLREALRTLDTLGLTHARHGDGVRVLDFRESGHLALLPHYLRVATDREYGRALADLLRFRATVALEVVAIAARRATRQDLERARDIVDSIERVIQGRDPRALGMLEIDLYRALTTASHSVAAVWILNGLEPVVRDLLEAAPQLWIVADDYLGAWRGIVAAIEARDGRKAQEILSDLLARTDRDLLEMLDPTDCSETAPIFAAYARRAASGAGFGSE